MTAQAASFPHNKPHWLDDRRFWGTASVVLGAVALLKGARMPGRWAATQALIDYDQGFVKRGLFGATVGHWLHLERYGRFSAFSYSVLLLFLGLLVTFALRSGALERLGSGEPVALFAASFATTYLAHLVGYLDLQLGVLTTALLLVRGPLLRLAAAVPVTVLALLLHEMFLLVFLPVVLFSLLVDAAALPQADRGRLIAGSSVLAALALVETCGLALTRPLAPAQVAAMQTQLAAKANFPLRGDMFEVMSRGVVDNVLAVWTLLRHDTGWDLTLLICAIVFAPSVYLLAHGVSRAASAVAQERPASRHLPALALAATLSPLLMYFVGWDSGRWNALVCLDGFLVLLVLARAMPDRSVQFSARYRNAVVLAIALSMATGEGLMDYRAVHAYPFVSDGIQAGARLAKHGWVAPDDAPPDTDE